MKTRNTITKLIAKTMAVAALAALGLLCGPGWLQPVKAQSGDGSVRFVSYASVGIVHGQRIRVSMSNTERSSGSYTLSFSYYLAHGTNASSIDPFYESESMTVPRGEFRFSEVRREDLKTEGEPETGRAQVIVRVTIVAPAGSDPEDFPGSLEVIDGGVQDGQTAQTDSIYRLVILAAKPAEQLAPIGFVPGQRLSYTFFNPNQEGSEPVRVQAYIYDATGRLLTQTNPVELRPGETYTSSIDRDDLSVAGEEGTGRLQVRPGIQVVLVDGSVRHISLPVWMEVVDKRTGSTTGSAGTYYTGTITVSSDGF